VGAGVGVSLGRAAHAEALAILPAEATRLHVFAREPEADGAVARVAEVEAELRRQRPAGSSTVVAAPGELVADVIVAADDPWLLGRIATNAPARLIPAALPVEVPADAPSRAYAKIVRPSPGPSCR
jgi:hypothetical protein